MALRKFFRTGCLTGMLGVGFLAAPPVSPAQFSDQGARITALGGAGAGLPYDAWAATNPAAWARIIGRATSLVASEAFGLSELRFAALAHTEPTRHGTFGVMGSTFGFEHYRETRFSAGFARSIPASGLHDFQAGILVSYQTVSISEYGAAGALGVSFGWTYAPSPSLSFGGAATNINRPKYARTEELPRALSLGVAIAPGGGAMLVADVFKENRFPAVLRMGGELTVVEAVILRTGFSADVMSNSAPSSELGRLTAGAGFRTGLIHADVAAERHPALGWSPAISISVMW